ncbi:aspartate-semialdehyde dehydrogenase [Candidatus Micrarchaeota archaeon]|nr:aspartate-semialdehyde dehydrogenase [Candidatus Micrarchaeota archaeon]
MIKTAVLGATGFVGQRFVQLLETHPWFEVTLLGASERSAGKPYAEACHWLLDSPMPDALKDLPVVECSPEKIRDVDLVFSALPGNLAGPLEAKLAQKGLKIVSKASAHRMEDDVPLIVPEVNPGHLALIGVQQERRGWAGFISTDPNCSTVPLAMALKPLMKYDVQRVHVATLQGLSGAGYPGVASLDALGNVVPFIAGEEEKVQTECVKLLGTLNGDSIQTAGIEVSASCNRVPVVEGHMENVFVEFQSEVSVNQIKKDWATFDHMHHPKLPSAQKPIQYLEQENRPQHRLDVMAGNGMTTTIGRLREDGPRRVKFTLLSHNTIRGAAGNGILHAELLKHKGLV